MVREYKILGLYGKADFDERVHASKLEHRLAVYPAAQMLNNGKMNWMETAPSGILISDSFLSTNIV